MGVTILVCDGQGVRGSVPQKIVLPAADQVVPIDLMFRPTRVFSNAFLCVRADETLIVCQRKMILTPGEMAVVTLTPALLEQCRGANRITIEIQQTRPSA